MSPFLTHSEIAIMDIHVSASEHVRVFIDGELQAEIAATCSTLKDLEKEVVDARTLQVLLRVNRELVSKLDSYDSKSPLRDRFIAGLTSGLSGETAQHPMPGVPTIAPDYQPDFHAGWRVGEALTRITNGRQNEMP